MDLYRFVVFEPWLISLNFDGAWNLHHKSGDFGPKKMFVIYPEFLNLWNNLEMTTVIDDS